LFDHHYHHHNYQKQVNLDFISSNYYPDFIILHDNEEVLDMNGEIFKKVSEVEDVLNTNEIG